MTNYDLKNCEGQTHKKMLYKELINKDFSII